jgi:hypothetical protein
LIKEVYEGFLVAILISYSTKERVAFSFSFCGMIQGTIAERRHMTG